MDGGIYTRERCSQCGKLLKYVGTKGCICPDHPGERARTFIVKFPGKIYKTFTNLDEAEQLLNYLRYEKGDRGERFNPLDYKDERPNSFSSLASSYLERKKGRRSFRKIRAIMDRACGVFGDMNLKDITSARIEAEGTQAGVEVYSANVFRELGEGIIDFPAIFRILDDAGYDEFLTVELDRSRFTNKESAVISMKYLKEHYRQD